MTYYDYIMDKQNDHGMVHPMYLQNIYVYKYEQR